MSGAIVGDILCSIYEKIPKHPLRVTMQATDDSILTCACYEWLTTLDSDTNYLYRKSVQTKIYQKAVRRLKKWAKLFPEKAGFSKGFTEWSAQPGYASKIANTNGCLMRSAPISDFSFSKKLSDENRYLLLDIFCKTTHDHIESYEACHQHSDLIMYSIENNIDDVKNYILTKHKEDLMTAVEWNTKSLDMPGKFIWTAKDSLSIAISSIYYSNSWEDMMNFLKTVDGDVDTYAAIAGPIGRHIYSDYNHFYQIALNVLINSNRKSDLHILNILNNY